MKEQRERGGGRKSIGVSTRLRKGEAYSTLVPLVKTPPKSSATPKAVVPASCKTYSKKGDGAAAMTIKELSEFIKEKAPEQVFTKFVRIQKKDRASLCGILAEFKEGYRLLYPVASNNKPASPTNKMPSANNLNGMFNLANRIQAAQLKKNVVKIISSRNQPGFVTSASPVSSVSSSPSTPNYINYGNNNNGSNYNRRLAREAYMRKLANKRVVKNTRITNLFGGSTSKIVPLKKGSVKKPRPPVRRSKSLTNLEFMKMINGNARAPTRTTGGLTISKMPKLSAAQLRTLKNQAMRAKNSLTQTLQNLKAIPPRNRTPLTRTRMRFIQGRLADNNFEVKFVRGGAYRETLLKRLGLVSPPQSPKALPPFSQGQTSAALTAEQMKRLTKLGSSKNKGKNVAPTVNVSTIKNRYEKSLLNSLVELRNFYGPLKRNNASSMNAIRKSISSGNRGGKFMLEGKSCSSYSKSKLVKIARMFTNSSIKYLESFTKDELCVIIKHNIRKK
jgi:hypothetical protein